MQAIYAAREGILKKSLSFLKKKPQFFFGFTTFIITLNYPL